MRQTRNGISGVNVGQLDLVVEDDFVCRGQVDRAVELSRAFRAEY